MKKNEQSQTTLDTIRLPITPIMRLPERQKEQKEKKKLNNGYKLCKSHEKL